ncbi:hypothetical protein MMC34_002712 [Xylographa carneopallida]|nr:hypothetical protein [Xylographa carneopallida]
MAATSIPRATYPAGHHPSVLRSHAWRTAANSAAYLLPHLRPTMTILDIGCGPATITCDLATHVPYGHVTGIDTTKDILATARATASSRGIHNATFETGDIMALRYSDATFDVVHVHQVLQHVSDPVGALREMRRVTKPGGVVAAREADFEAMAWWPDVAGMKAWQQLYMRVARKSGGEPDAGRMLAAWAREAGFAKEMVRSSAGTWCYSTEEEVRWWSCMWAERTVKSGFAGAAVEGGFVDEEGLKEVARVWREWGGEEDAWFVLVHGEVICLV